MVVPIPASEARGHTPGRSSAVMARGRARRALLNIYSPIQTAVWMNAHSAGDPLEVAAKATALAGPDHRSDPARHPGSTSSTPGPHDQGPAAAVTSPEADPTPGSASVTGTDVDGGPGGGAPVSEGDAQAVAIATMRAMVACHDPDEVRSLAFEATYALGGEIVERPPVTGQAVAIDLADGTSTRFAIPADAQSWQRLATHLPSLVDHGRDVVAWMSRSAASSSHPRTTVDSYDRVTYERLAGRVHPGAVAVSLDVDASGDPVEDARLRGLLVEVLRQEVRADEPLASLGPDGFLVVLRATDGPAPQRFLQRVRDRWDAEHRCPVAVSAGVAVIADGLDEALDEATRSRTIDARPVPIDRVEPR